MLKSRNIELYVQIVGSGTYSIKDNDLKLGGIDISGDAPYSLTPGPYMKRRDEMIGLLMMREPYQSHKINFTPKN